jgi:hypothetical protein
MPKTKEQLIDKFKELIHDDTELHAYIVDQIHETEWDFDTSGALTGEQEEILCQYQMVLLFRFCSELLSQL